MLNLGVATVFCLTPSAAAFETYRVSVVGFAAAGIIYSTNSTNNLVYTGRAADAAAAAGYILQSIINIIWVFYFGTTKDATVHAFVDSYALGRDSSSIPASPAGAMKQPSTAATRSQQQFAMQTHQLGQGRVYSPRPAPPLPPQSATQGMYTSAQLGGFETASMREPVRTGTALTFQQQFQQQQLQQQQQQQHQQAQPQVSAYTGSTSNILVAQSTGSNANATNDLMEPLDTPTEYLLRARAIYSYDANPEDSNEISFVKGEVLEVSDVSGRWWQARRANGEVGICPSNYVQLLD